jgi:hypothetical protein
VAVIVTAELAAAQKSTVFWVNSDVPVFVMAGVNDVPEEARAWVASVHPVDIVNVALPNVEQPALSST